MTWAKILLNSQDIWFNDMVSVLNFCDSTRERPKGGFGLTAATVLRPQGPSLIAAATETFGRKRIAAERAHFGRKSPYGELPKGITVKKSHRKILFRPKWALLAAILLRPKGPLG